MKSNVFTSFVATSGILVAGGVANAATLINTYPTASTSNIVATESSIEPNTSVNGAERTVILANNGFNNTTGEHAAGTQQSWRSNNGGTLSEQWIQWDLGASYQLGAIQLWNYNDSSRYQAGVRQVDIYFSNAASPGDPEAGGTWTLWAENAILAPGPGSAGYTGFDLETQVGASLPTSDIRFVRFEVDSTFKSDGINLGGGTLDGANVAALAQIEFFEADPIVPGAIPEPSVALLSGLGLLALLRRRRA